MGKDKQKSLTFCTATETALRKPPSRFTENRSVRALEVIQSISCPRTVSLPKPVLRDVGLTFSPNPSMAGPLWDPPENNRFTSSTLNAEEFFSKEQTNLSSL